MSEDGRWDPQGKSKPCDASTVEEAIEAMKAEALWPEPLFAGQIGKFRDAQEALRQALREPSASPADIDLLTREVLSLIPAARGSEGYKYLWRETARVRETYGLSPLAPPPGSEATEVA